MNQKCSITVFTAFIFDGISIQLPLYASLHFQTYGILTVMTSESATVSDLSPHAIFAVK